MPSVTLQQVYDWIGQNLTDGTFDGDAELFISSYFESKKQFHFDAFKVTGVKPHFLYIPEDTVEKEPAKLCLGKFVHQSTQLPDGSAQPNGRE